MKHIKRLVFLALAFALVFATNLKPSTVQAQKALVIGFAQTGSESGWRTAFTNSMKAEATKEGIDLKFSDGQQKQEVQIAALRSLIAASSSPVPAPWSLPISTRQPPACRMAKS